MRDLRGVFLFAQRPSSHSAGFNSRKISGLARFGLAITLLSAICVLARALQLGAPTFKSRAALQHGYASADNVAILSGFPIIH